MSGIVASMNDQIDVVRQMLAEKHPRKHRFEDHPKYHGCCVKCGWVSPEARDETGASMRDNLKEVLAEMIKQRDLVASGKACVTWDLEDCGSMRVVPYEESAK